MAFQAVTAPTARVAYVALGSNLGDREENLAFARAQLELLPESQLLAASGIEETAPLGDVPQGDYLNQMVSLSTTLPAGTLLEHLHRIERSAGRIRRERWGPRTLDLDIVLIEGETHTGDRLVLPHPGLCDRTFWQRELEELRSLSNAPVKESSSSDAPVPMLPPWAVVSEKRLAHIARVTTLLGHWADVMQVGAEERRAWYDAGRWHDALRDADEGTLRALVPDAQYTPPMLHGPAAAARLAAEGERRTEVLEAVHYHTVGCSTWARTGRALYMADYLEPGRKFAREERAAMAARVPWDFDAVFAAVVRHRIEWALREGKALYPECVALWNSVR